MLGHRRQVEHGPGGPVVLQHVVAHVIPVLLEVFPGLGHGSHAHAVHPVPLHVLVEQLALLFLGEATAQPFRRQQRGFEEGRVRPVEDVGVERAVAPALIVDALDADVVVADLRARGGRPVAVEDDTADGIHGPEQARHPLQEEDGVLLDRGAQLGMHVLHRPRPRPLQHAGPLAEVPPRQRVRTQRLRRSVVAAADRAAGRQGLVVMGRSRGLGACRGRILSHWSNFPREVGETSDASRNFDYIRCHQGA